MKKDRISKEEILNQLNQSAETKEEVIGKKPRMARGSSDLANKYKFTYAKTYKDLPNWKKQVIDNKEYDDRIYKEFIEEVIRETEQSQVDWRKVSKHIRIVR